MESPWPLLKSNDLHKTWIGHDFPADNFLIDEVLYPVIDFLVTAHDQQPYASMGSRTTISDHEGADFQKHVNQKKQLG